MGKDISNGKISGSAEELLEGLQSQLELGLVSFIGYGVKILRTKKLTFTCCSLPISSSGTNRVLRNR